MKLPNEREDIRNEKKCYAENQRFFPWYDGYGFGSYRDGMDRLWSYENNFLIKGDEVKITFFDNHTDDITDDEIVKIKVSKIHK